MLSKSLKSNKKTVSEQVAEILNPKDDEVSSDECGGNEVAPKIVAYDEDDYELPDARSTEFRKRNVKMLSEQSARYRGKVASRKDFEDVESVGSVEGEEEIESSDYSSEDSRDDCRRSESPTASSGDNSDDDQDIDTEQFEESDDDDMTCSDDDDGEENVYGSESLIETNKNNEIRKGVCVRNQLNIWEKLLELRIHTQKILSKANLLPEPAVLQQEQKEDKRVSKTSQEAAQNVANLLSRLFELQRSLYGQFSEIKTGLKNAYKRSLPLSADCNTGAPPLKRVAEHMEVNFRDFKSYRNTVLLKWDDRTKLLTPGAGSKKKTMNEEYDVIRKINNILLNRNSLIKKSQTLKASSTNQENDFGHEISLKPYVYDDTDFYHQQLRELIEYKTSSTTNAAEVTRQLIELQKLRQKMKKKVDTRASKGRKIRYAVHKKLVNLMAPCDTSSWTDESKDELYKSLFSS